MKKSAGIVLYQRREKILEVFLVHPGGPYWKNKDFGAWSIPKGEIDEHEDPFLAAKRELKEETGIEIIGNGIELSPIRQKNGKMVICWAIEAVQEIKFLVSNEFEMEWPPKSGKMQLFPEVDKGEWFPAEIAQSKILSSQWPIIKELESKLSL